ncbi:MAG: M24 family metallopeptidase [Candidatus Acidiferrales bacterium]
MSIKNYKELLALKEVGRIVRLALEAMAASVRAGVTTAELAKIGGKVMRENGARSAPRMVYGFPGDVLISLNDEAVHGIPSDSRKVRAGDLVKLDVTFEKAMKFARADHRVNEIGRAVEREVRRSGFRVIRELGGHGIGRTIHEEPSVPNYDDPLARQRLTEGLVLTVEPIIAMGSGKPKDGGDGWTVKTADGGLSAHYEHTIVITDGAPMLLTAA